jgi:alkylation response protein AidB-like acyl-CoA dehydrogenase
VTKALSWLDPLRSGIPELGRDDWAGLAELSEDLEGLCGDAPADPGPARSAWLLALRRELAARRRAPQGVGREIWQTLAQFLAGFHDLDLRDTTGPGHGAMVLAEGTPEAVAVWSARLAGGDLVGIAATERHGGSRIQEISTRAGLARGGRWRITGEKCWVSRLTEAAGFVVFFRDPDGRISAAIVDGQDPGLEREIREPLGLSGWSWGVLRLHGVVVDPVRDLVGRPGEGLAVFRRHFARFRPLVTVTALGTAAGVHTLVVEALASRVTVGGLPRVRDNALITLGRTQAEITAGVLMGITGSRLAVGGHAQADGFTRIGKASGVDTAHRVVQELAPLIGAAGYQRGHPAAKARVDLTGLLYADGIHDSLYRSGGQALLACGSCASVVPIRPEMMMPPEHDAAA